MTRHVCIIQCCYSHVILCLGSSFMVFSLPSGHVMDVAASYDGLYLCTIADDRSLKVFDVVNFGMCVYLFYHMCVCE